ncbi:hypothetical protein [Oceanobacillus jeddahense]|uniref:Apea-like HEPN domain-containing protein n=1 Tax=Oceanobacillus jeddahense TaxID=1462527 RepID=A0ABY5JVB6_9BACI|nr:hypothetical protein [Oceanobacillus jeddahense]UUI02529.1 hypothetical protein NP439_21210 [Oceanobacillus jeddahense]
MKEFENVYYLYGSESFDMKKFLNGLLMKDIQENEPDARNGIVIELDNTKNNFTHTYGKRNYRCNFSMQSLSSEEEVFKFSISLKYSTKKETAAFAFSDLIRYIQKNKKNQFYMVAIKDSLSLYYSERVYGRLSNYERKMRALILAIFIPAYNKSWVKELKNVTTEETSKKLQENSMLEKALENLDLNNLEEIFFELNFNVDKNNYDEKFDVINIENLTKEDLVAIIKKNKPVSFWDKYISRYVTIDNARHRMNKIRNQRNRVAHHKTFSDRNFKELKNELDCFILKLSEAESKIIEEHSEPNTVQLMGGIIDSVTKLNLDLSFLKQFQESISQIVPPSFKAIDFALSEQISAPLQEAIENFNKILRPLNNFNIGPLFSFDGLTEDSEDNVDDGNDDEDYDNE